MGSKGTTTLANKSKDYTIATETIPWQYLERSRHKGYTTRDFFVGTRRYKHAWSGADNNGIIRYGILQND